MGNYGLPIMHLIHNANHTRFSRKCVINHQNQIINHPGLIKFPKVFRDLEPGIHKLVFSDCPDKVFYMNVYCKVGPGQNIVINNINFAMYNTGNSRYPIQLYEAEECYHNDPIKIINTVNSNLDLIMIEGETNITREKNFTKSFIDHPCSLSFIDKLSINTWNDDVTDANSLSFNLRHELRSLPSGLKDIFVVDAENQRSYILYKTGHCAITGMEEIIKVESFSNRDVSVYFIKNENVKKTYSKDDLTCTHFQSIDYEAFRKMEFLENAICISDDNWRGRGFYIKISNEIAPDIESFVNLINRRWFKEQKLEVVFPLISPYQSNVLLDEYHVKTFFGNTYLEVDEDYPITYFYKTALKHSNNEFKEDIL